MKKMIMIILLLFVSIKVLLAPISQSLNIFISPSINYYDPLIKAINWVEVKDGMDLYNEKENAVGYFQIRPVRVNDYNKRTSSSYTLHDFYDYELSRKMFLYYTYDYKNQRFKTYEKAARDWNGSGKMTIEYWKKVKAKL